MESVKRLLNSFGKWEYAELLVLVLVTLALHLSIIMQPDRPLFDEHHYVSDAGLILEGEGTERTEHPPLGKLLIASGIRLFGDNPFGWRFFSVLSGTIGTILFYLICRQLTLSRKASFLATFLLALENLSFVQASIAMLDVYSLVFTMGAFWLYLRGNYAMSGVAIGLSALAKLSGVLALPVIGLHWFLTGWKRPWRFLTSMLLAPVAFLLLMPLFDFIIWHKWFNPIERMGTMLRLSSSITNAQYPDVGSRPWEWILFPEVMPYWWTPNYTGMISPTLWAFILPVVIYITFRAIKGNTPVLLPFAWFLGTYLIWIPISLITDRVTYIYYFYFTIGAICIGLGIISSQLPDIASKASKIRWLIRLVVPIYILGHLVAFIVLAPVSLWWSIPLSLLLYIFSFRFLGFGRRLELPSTL